MRRWKSSPFLISQISLPVHTEMQLQTDWVTLRGKSRVSPLLVGLYLVSPVGRSLFATSKTIRESTVEATPGRDLQLVAAAPLDMPVPQRYLTDVN